MGKMKEMFQVSDNRASRELLERTARIERIRQKKIWRNRREKKLTNDASEDMKRRIASGEFGNPKKPDMQAVNDAWADILETKLKEVGKDGNFNTISGLWPRKGDKVAFDGRTQEEMTIPAGSKVLCFYGNPEPNSRQPEYRLVYVTYDD